MTADLTADLTDQLLIRQMIERWAVWRDAGDWERFATVWQSSNRAGWSARWNHPSTLKNWSK